MKRALVFLAAIAATSATVAHAQDQPRIGLTIGYPSAVGVIWRIADRVAVRPDFTWTKSSTDAPALTDPTLGAVGNATNSDTSQAGAGIAGLFYVGRYEGLRAYLAPRIGYSRSSTSSNATGLLAGSSGTTTTWSTSGSFGVQYTLGRRFGLFGEVGLHYQAGTALTTLVESRTVFGTGNGGLVTTSTFTVRSESHSHSVSTRSGAGVIFYF